MCSVLIEDMKNVDVTKVNPNDLIDIQEVKLNRRLSKDCLMQDYIEQIKNPYCYKHGDYIVKIGFNETEVTLSDRLREVILKTADGMNT